MHMNTISEPHTQTRTQRNMNMHMNRKQEHERNKNMKVNTINEKVSKKYYKGNKNFRFLFLFNKGDK